MYNLSFYIIYRTLNALGGKDSVFTATLFTTVLIGLHLMGVGAILVYLNVIDSFPRFSDSSFYNKLYLYIPSLVLVGLVFMYFTKERAKRIIEKYEQRDQAISFLNVLFFLVLLAVPIFLLATIDVRGK